MKPMQQKKSKRNASFVDFDNVEDNLNNLLASATFDDPDMEQLG